MDAAGDADVGVKVMWRPDPTRITLMDEFRLAINKKYDVNLQTYNDLYQWSVDSYAEFWEEFWHYAGIISSQDYDQVIDKKKRIDEIPEWFSGSRMNFAQNLLKYNDDRTAVYYVSEGHMEVRSKTFAELRLEVARYAASMRKLGIERGDRVVGYLPNCVEAVEAMLAAASIGAIWSSTSPDFGVSGVLDRFSQIKPKLIFSVNAVVYNGKTHNHLEKLVQVVKGLPDLEKVVIVPYVGDRKDSDITHIKNGCFLNEFFELGQVEGKTPELSFEQLPFNHPLYIMYSSGTTGAPKCMVHSAGGTLIQHLKEHILHGNMTRDDILLYYTTTGWMMWNWFVSALAVGSAIVLFDGSPLVPGPHVLWDLIDNIGISILGTGAKWLAVLDERGIKPRETHKLTTLTTILSTGSPLKPQTYEFVYRHVKQDLLLGSISGGTDLISCFAGQNWTVPVYKGEIQSANLGMAIQSWNEDGKPVVGESGELVCIKPFPSMPTYFWNDLEGLKYKKAYFNKYDGVWAHGDFLRINPDNGGILMLGRSDGTLNPNGVRFGSAEIYNIVEAFKEIQDSVCVGQNSKVGMEERVILFLKMADGVEFSENLVKRLRTEIRMQLSARHVPTIIMETKDIPYTQSGKKVEVAIKKIISGEDIKQRGAYANPNSLDLYYNLPQLTGF